MGYRVHRIAKMTLTSCPNKAIYKATDEFQGEEFFVCYKHRTAFFKDELKPYTGLEKCGHEGNVPATEQEAKNAMRKAL